MSWKLSRRARTFSANLTALVSWKVYTTDPTMEENNCTYISHCWRSIDGGTEQNRMFGSIINEFDESHRRSNNRIFFNSMTSPRSRIFSPWKQRRRNLSGPQHPPEPGPVLRLHPFALQHLRFPSSPGQKVTTIRPVVGLRYVAQRRRSDSWKDALGGRALRTKITPKTG